MGNDIKLKNINTVITAFSDDTLGRKSIAEQFKKILLNTNLNVFSIVAPWGCGKTYFINNLIKFMENDSINILYNAWESDFYDSPLIPLMMELLAKIEDYVPHSNIDDDIKWSKEFTQKICNKMNYQLGLNVGIFNFSVGFDPNKKMIESEYIELKNSIKDFKNRLQIIQQKLNKKIIIFIDELDRCHPMYTIKTLEVIKHFFGIPNIIFVLAVDKSQIENSVRTIYGINQGQEDGYLRKFIDVEYQLVKYNSKDFIAYHMLKIQDKIKLFFDNDRYYNYQKAHDINMESVNLCNLIFTLTNALSFSLRDLEKLFIRFDLLLDIFLDSDLLIIEPFIVLNILLMKSEEDFNSYISNKNLTENVKLINNIFPHWKGFFANLYPTYLDNHRRWDTVKSNTPEANSYELKNFLGRKISGIVEEQSKYLYNYSLNIKSINNFNS